MTPPGFRSIGPIAIATALCAFLTCAQATPAQPPHRMPHPVFAPSWTGNVCVTSAGVGPTDQAPGTACVLQTSSGPVFGVVRSGGALAGHGPPHAPTAALIHGIPIGAGGGGGGGGGYHHAFRPPENVGPPHAVVRPIGTRLFISADGKIPEGYGAIAIVVFPRAPVDADDRERAQFVCRAYVGALPDSARVRALDPNRPQMVTVWPRRDLFTYASVVTPASEADLTKLCNDAVQNYYYEAAQTWLARVPTRAGLDASKRGPFLIAWAPPSGLDDPRNPILIFDLSDFDQEDVISEAFSMWKDEIEADPRLWENGWDLTRWRLYTRAGLDHYGPEILAAIQLVPFLNAQPPR
jgi:hypothetical protein